MTCLTEDLDADKITPRQFWGSGLGNCLRTSAGIGVNFLSFEACKVLLGFSDDAISDFPDDYCATRQDDSDNDTMDGRQDKKRDRGKLFDMRNCAISGLTTLLQLAETNASADQEVYNGGKLNSNQLCDTDAAGKAASIRIFRQLSSYHVWLT